MSDDWPAAGTLLATRYRLVVLLETGGMAQVWRATDELLGRPVAIKLATGPQVAWREARMAAKLSHPNIAAVHDYREAVRDDGSVAPFVVMELLSGETVAARLERETFSWPEAARVGAAVADALAAAHDNGVVHRDIKPGNVMLTPTGVKILDFGISATAGEPDDDDTGATFGTPAYVAPERLDGMPAEPATDVYGLGVLLFEMVTGDPPYPVNTWEELDEARLSGPTTLPESLPADFRAVVDHCLEEAPADRPGADEIRFTLTALWLADQPADEKTPALPSSDPAAGTPAQEGPGSTPGGPSQGAASPTHGGQG
ncbi:serine/threonine-protein kinase, partial [Paractinoplanes toevensis]|uniref:serine/threonine-protein kinase n=1 Tax=Paractinoplanes toevensis TaxID=571911 RepID=UPI001BB34F4B